MTPADTPPPPSQVPAPSRGGPDWDARYAAAPEPGLFGDVPNLFLRMALARPGPAPRSALLIADGDGRNSTWLAGTGASPAPPAVTAFDLSSVAVARAAARDRAAGVRVERFAADVTQWAPEGRGWDLVALLHLQGPESLRRAGFAAAAAALAPGGRLLLEGFAGEGGKPGPERSSQRWQEAEAEAWVAAAGLALEELMEGAVALDEGAKHQGRARMLRLIARRPG
ncbi:MAG: methyltransferase domain-containing protein [Pseudomonadota bacterium]|nr:methyltransferase domain-containing protein [Pseudomonadota bacterium]